MPGHTTSPQGSSLVWSGLVWQVAQVCLAVWEHPPTRQPVSVPVPVPRSQSSLTLSSSPSPSSPVPNPNQPCVYVCVCVCQQSLPAINLSCPSAPPSQHMVKLRSTSGLLHHADYLGFATDARGREATDEPAARLRNRYPHPARCPLPHGAAAAAAASIPFHRRCSLYEPRKVLVSPCTTLRFTSPLDSASRCRELSGLHACVGTPAQQLTHERP